MKSYLTLHFDTSKQSVGSSSGENTRSAKVDQIQCLPQDQVLILLFKNVNLNKTYPKTNITYHSFSFGNMNCLLMHFNPDIFQFKLKINIHIFEIT